MNFRLKDTQMSNDRSTEARQEAAGLELDTPYFRRSMAQRGNVGMQLIELRIDQFLEENGVTYVKLDEEFDDAPVNKNLNFLTSPSNNKRTSVSERLDDSRRSSFSSFSLDTNSLFLRRKTSTNQPPPSHLRDPN